MPFDKLLFDKFREPLADSPAAPSSRPGTSQDAARRITLASGRLRNEVYAAVRAAGASGLTDEEIQAALALSPNTARPRRWELERSGAVRDSGLRRKTTAGRWSIVWVVAEPDAPPTS